MTIDTSREAVERLLAERDAALADVARLSTALAAETAKRGALEAALQNVTGHPRQSWEQDMTIYDQQEKIVEKKFYHSEWKLTDLLKARNDGLLTDEGEAWKYRYSHMDGTGGKYDMLFRREPAAIEAPAQEPVAWRAKDPKHEGWWIYFPDRQADGQPLYTTPPDHLALVAAAYRDAEDKAHYDYREWDNATPIECDATACEYVADAIRKLTPADAEARLTALLRAEYERGVRDAVQVIDERLEGASTYGEWAQGWIASLNGARGGILGLLTQEGR